jgi:hypothetical protein
MVGKEPIGRRPDRKGMECKKLFFLHQLPLPGVGLADQGDSVLTIGRFGYGPLHSGSLVHSDSFQLLCPIRNFSLCRDIPPSGTQRARRILIRLKALN